MSLLLLLLNVRFIWVILITLSCPFLGIILRWETLSGASPKKTGTLKHLNHVKVAILKGGGREGAQSKQPVEAVREASSI